MVKARHKPPSPRPGQGSKVKITKVVQDGVIVVAAEASYYEKFLVMYHGRMAGSASRRDAMKVWLMPMRGLEIKDDEVVQVRPVFIFTTKYQDLVALTEGCSEDHAHTRNIAIVVYQAPLSRLNVQS